MPAKAPLNAPKKQQPFYSGKKHQHTLKFQIILDPSSGFIVHVAQAQANEHDVTLARQHTACFPPDSLCVGDLGYQGLEIEQVRVLIPYKKPKQCELEPEQIAFNQQFARLRVIVEHAIRRLKIFRILKERYRNRRRRFKQRLQLMTGIVNWMAKQG